MTWSSTRTRAVVNRERVVAFLATAPVEITLTPEAVRHDVPCVASVAVNGRGYTALIQRIDGDVADLLILEPVEVDALRRWLNRMPAAAPSHPFTPADVSLLADIADGFSTVLHYDRLDALRARMRSFVHAVPAALSAVDREPEATPATDDLKRLAEAVEEHRARWERREGDFPEWHRAVVDLGNKSAEILSLIGSAK